MKDDEINEKLKNLFKMNEKLSERGGPEEDGVLFEEIMMLRESILTDFGLTPTVKNCEYLMLYNEHDDLQVAIEMTKLFLKMQEKTEGEENLSSLEVLSTGIAESLPPGDVLPKMGILTHDYTFFLYDLLQNDPSLMHDIYNEMMRSKDYLEQIYLCKDNYLDLKLKNIEFLDLYMQS